MLPAGVAGCGGGGAGGSAILADSDARSLREANGLKLKPPLLLAFSREVLTRAEGCAGMGAGIRSQSLSGSANQRSDMNRQQASGAGGSWLCIASRVCS